MPVAPSHFPSPIASAALSRMLPRRDGSLIDLMKLPADRLKAEPCAGVGRHCPWVKLIMIIQHPVDRVDQGLYIARWHQQAYLRRNEVLGPAAARRHDGCPGGDGLCGSDAEVLEQARQDEEVGPVEELDYLLPFDPSMKGHGVADAQPRRHPFVLGAPRPIAHDMEMEIVPALAQRPY